MIKKRSWPPCVILGHHAAMSTIITCCTYRKGKVYLKRYPCLSPPLYCSLLKHLRHTRSLIMGTPVLHKKDTYGRLDCATVSVHPTLGTDESEEMNNSHDDATGIFTNYRGSSLHSQDTASDTGEPSAPFSKASLSLGRPITKKPLHKIDILVVVGSLVCLFFAIVAVASEEVSWRLGRICAPRKLLKIDY